MSNWIWLPVGLVLCVVFVIFFSMLVRILWNTPQIKGKSSKLKNATVIKNFMGADMVVEKLPDRNRYWLDVMGHPVVMMVGDTLLKDLEEGDKLGPDTLDFIIENQGLCPFCLEGHLCEGPHGGMAVNYDCNHCGSKVNFIGPFGIDVMIIRSRAYRTGRSPKDGLALVPDTSESPS